MPQCRGGLACGPRFAGCAPEPHLFSEPWQRPKVPTQPSSSCPQSFQPFSVRTVFSWIPELGLARDGWAVCSQDLARLSGAGCPDEVGLDLPPKSSTGGPGSPGG